MKIRIEMEVPDDLDPSTILERMQEQAIEWAEEYAQEQDDDDDDMSEVEIDKDAIENAVSVEICNEKSAAA